MAVSLLPSLALVKVILIKIDYIAQKQRALAVSWKFPLCCETYNQSGSRLLTLLSSTLCPPMSRSGAGINPAASRGA